MRLPAPSSSTTVNDLAADPSAYVGQVAVIGVVAAVKSGQGFTIVDKREYAACGLSCFNEPDTRKIPVRWDGDPPKMQQRWVRITGVLEKSDRGLVFSAKNVVEVAEGVKGKQSGTAPRLIWLLATVAFVAVFVGHVLYLRYLTIAPQKGWGGQFQSFGLFLAKRARSLRLFRKLLLRTGCQLCYLGYRTFSCTFADERLQ